MFGDKDNCGALFDAFFQKKENAIKYAASRGWKVITNEPEDKEDIEWIGNTNECYIIECGFKEE